MLNMAWHKFISHVCEKALVTASAEEWRALVDEIIAPKPDGVSPIVSMMKDQFASKLLRGVRDCNWMMHFKIMCYNEHSWSLIRTKKICLWARSALSSQACTLTRVPTASNWFVVQCCPSALSSKLIILQLSGSWNAQSMLPRYHWTSQQTTPLYLRISQTNVMCHLPLFLWQLQFISCIFFSFHFLFPNSALLLLIAILWYNYINLISFHILHHIHYPRKSWMFIMQPTPMSCSFVFFSHSLTLQRFVKLMALTEFFFGINIPKRKFCVTVVCRI